MRGFIIGFVFGVMLATNVDLRPVYNDYVKPKINSGVDKIKGYTKKNE